MQGVAAKNGASYDPSRALALGDDFVAVSGA